jgi:DNA-binding response OmpR family regulator
MESMPAIVISDFHLGGNERGSDAIETIRRHFDRRLPAILLTGDTSAVPAKLATEAGLRMLNKPVDAARLVAVMDELLRLHPQ